MSDFWNNSNFVCAFTEVFIKRFGFVLCIQNLLYVSWSDIWDASWAENKELFWLIDYRYVNYVVFIFTVTGLFRIFYLLIDHLKIFIYCQIISDDTGIQKLKKHMNFTNLTYV